MKSHILFLLCLVLVSAWSSAAADGITGRFQLVPGAFTWDEAKADAEARGGHLATITSMTEFQTIQASVSNLLSAPFWIGLHRSDGSPQWQWVTGEPYKFTMWAPGQPEGGAGLGDAAGLSPSATWNDVFKSNSDLGPYLLEYELPCTIPRRASAQAQVVNGFVVGVEVTDSGCGYTNAPVVEISGGGGSGATALATVTNGLVSSVSILNAGSGYSSPPLVRIASPPISPWLNVAVSKVKVTQHVTLGKKYSLEASSDLRTWLPIGSEFVAADEEIVQELDVTPTGRYFRIREVQ